jgi:serine/threonine protein kinase
MRKLGAGGMCEVYLAEDSRLDRKAARKILPEDLTDGEERARGFTFGAALRQISHAVLLTRLSLERKP